MVSENSSKAAPPQQTKKKTKNKLIKWLLIAVFVLIVAVFFIIPAFVSSEKGRKIILAKINKSIDGEVNFADLSMSWAKGIKVTDFSFNDGTGQTLVEVKQITTKPRYGSILMGSLSFGKTIIDEPKVEINLKARQPKKTQQHPQKTSTEKKYQAIALPIRKINLIVNNGNLKVIDPKAETAEVAEIFSSLNINFPGEYPAGQTEKLLANLKAKVKLGFAKARYMGWNFGPTKTEIQIKNGLLKIASFSSKVNNGQLNFAGQLNLKHDPALLKTAEPIQIAKDIQIDDETTERLLMYLNPVFANAVNVSGVANFNCDRLSIPLAAAHKNDIELIGTISVNQLRLQASDLLGQLLSLAGTSVRDQDITIRPTKFVLQNGFLQYDDMQIDVGDNPINFKGVIGLDKSLNMTVTLPYTTSGRTARLGRETVGKRISLPLKGTINKPELDVGKLLEEQLKEELQMRLKKELGDRLEDELTEKVLEGLEELLK